VADNRRGSFARTARAPFALAGIVLHLAWGAAVAGALFPVLPMRACNALVRFWSRIALVILGIDLELRIEPQSAPIAGSGGALLLANHISWADVFVIAAVTPARFVAKSEIAHWPLLGRFARMVGTVFVARNQRHAVALVNRVIAKRLRAGQTIAIFPEGTTTEGDRLLRFHANLVQPALDASAPLIPLGLQYLLDGQPTSVPAFVGDMNLAQSIWRILTTPRLRVRLHWLRTLQAQAGETRQAIGERARSAIAEALQINEVTTWSDPPAKAGPKADHPPVP